MKFPAILMLFIFALVTPVSVLAQTGTTRPNFNKPGYTFRGPHSWDDPKNRPIDARGVNTRSTTPVTKETKVERRHNFTPSTIPKNINMHGTYGIAK